MTGSARAASMGGRDAHPTAGETPALRRPGRPPSTALRTRAGEARLGLHVSKLTNPCRALPGWAGEGARPYVGRAGQAAPLVTLFRYDSTSSEWPSGFTLWKMCLILPSGPIMKVVRTTPITFFPYMFFSLNTS